MKSRNFLIIGLTLILAVPAFLLETKNVQAYSPNYLISDTEFVNWRTLDANGIQAFLNTRGGTRLRTYSQGRTAAQIIADAARSNQINPYVILATIQKEESIVDSNYNFDYRVNWAMGYGVCDGCSLDDPSVAKYHGFTNQIDNGAWQLRRNYDYWASNGSDWNVGKTMIIDGTGVYFSNRATSSLYRYTPHLHGNQNFSNIYNSYRVFKGSAKFGKASSKAALVQAKLDLINQKGTAATKSVSQKVADKLKLINSKEGGASSADTYNAEFVTKVEPGVLVPGQTYKIYAYFRNTGSASWSNSGASPVRLGNYGHQDRSSAFTGGNPRWQMLNSSITPGKVGVFSIQITAPGAGSYTEKFRPLSEGVTWFGNEAVFNFNVGSAAKTVK